MRWDHLELARRNPFMCRMTGRSFLRVLWREQHPDGHEQGALNFAMTNPTLKNVPLFADLDGMTAKERRVRRSLRARDGGATVHLL